MLFGGDAVKKKALSMDSATVERRFRGRKYTLALDMKGRVKPTSTGNAMVDDIASFMLKNAGIGVNVRGDVEFLDVDDFGFSLGFALKMLGEEKGRASPITGGHYIVSDGESSCSFTVALGKRDEPAEIRIAGGKPETGKDIDSFFFGLSRGMESKVTLFLQRGRDEKKAWDVCLRAFTSTLQSMLGKELVAQA